MKMYTNKHATLIEECIDECEVIKVTNKFVVFANGRKSLKDSRCNIYRESKQEVKDVMINRILSDIKETEKTLDYLKNQLERTKNI